MRANFAPGNSFTGNACKKYTKWGGIGARNPANWYSGRNFVETKFKFLARSFLALMKKWARRLFSSLGGISSIGLLSFRLSSCTSEIKQRSAFVFVVVLLFLFSALNDKISLSSNCFSSFHLSNTLRSTFASHSDFLSSKKQFKLSAVFFVTLIEFVTYALRESLSNRSSGVQIPRDFCP